MTSPDTRQTAERRTPRTDAVTHEHVYEDGFHTVSPKKGGYWVKADDARQLEIELQAANERLEAKEKEPENFAMFIKRLCRRLYSVGHRSKLTADAMDFINSTDAKCSPMRKLMNEIMPAHPSTRDQK